MGGGGVCDADRGFCAGALTGAHGRYTILKPLTSAI
jgi:hypothetical protein